MSRVERPRHKQQCPRNVQRSPQRPISPLARDVLALQPGSRRAFLQRLVVAGTGLVFPFDALRAAGTVTRNKTATEPGPFKEPWATIAAVQEHLFPDAAGIPGANAIQATAYLQGVVDEPRFDAEEKHFILNGPEWLNQLAIKQYRVPFVSLKESQREQLLRQVSESRAGENWLSTLLLYLFEALLSPPVYGANPRAVGWKWLQHEPGFPQPNASQRWTELIKK